MAQTGRTFRVFVSSTFSDLKAERNALAEHVWPKLQDLCRRHGSRFQAIDLRWGVSEEAGRDQRTMDVCLGEIARCQAVSPRPNFVVLLGDRYGWRPLPAQVPADEFDAIRVATPPADLPLLDAWYRRDDNAVPPGFVLLPRTTDAHDRDWTTIEAELRRILLAGIAAGNVAVRDRSIYDASATEQEIAAGALSVEDAKDHVVCVLREIEGLPTDATAGDFSGTDDDSRRRQVLLKDALRVRLGDEGVLTLPARWTGAGPTLDHLGRLCEEVLARLTKTIETEIARFEEEDPLVAEDRAHVEFGVARARGFVGREEPLRAIDDYLRGSDPHPLLLHGPSGCGKSAVIARAVELAAAPGRTIVARFLGATPESASGRDLLDGLCRVLSKAYGVEPPAAGMEYRDLSQELPKRLALATVERPLIVFLDALDQLDAEDPASDCWWLPRDLPPHVRLVASMLDGPRYDNLHLRAPRSPSIALDGLAAEEGAALLAQWLRDGRRTLTSAQRDAVLAAFAQQRLPLWLRVAFEQARRWRSFDAPAALPADVPALIRRRLAELSDERNHGRLLVERGLALIAAGRHGLTEDELVDVLSGDETSREVLDEFQRRSPKSPVVDRLPIVLWSRLYLDLAPYLVERAADGTRVYGFFHREVREVVESEYLRGASARLRHGDLARFFVRRPIRSTSDGRDTFHTRVLAELPFQQRGAEDWSALEHTLLGRYEFIAAKSYAGLILELVGDCAEALAALPLSRESRPPLRLLECALRLSSHVLLREPAQLPGQLHGRLLGFDHPAIRAVLDGARRETRHAWLRPCHPALTPPGGALVRTLAGHRGAVTSVAVTTDGRRAVSASEDTTLRVWDLETGAPLQTLKGHTFQVRSVAVLQGGNRAVSGAYDATPRVWDLDTGETLLTLRGHTERVLDLRLTPDSRRAVSISDDRTLRVWDLETGAMLVSVRPPNGVNSVHVTPDGRRAVTGSGDEAICVWDLASGEMLRRFRGRTDFWARCVAVTDHRVFSELCDALHLLDIDNGKTLLKVKGKRLQAAAPMPDGRRMLLALAGEGTTLLLLDLESGETLRTFDHDGADLNCLTVTGDGVQAIAGSDYVIPGMSRMNVLRVWDVESGRLLRRTEGHTDGILSVALTPGGRRAISGSRDTTVRVWDLEAPESPFERARHDTAVHSVAITADGRRAVSGSRDGTLRVWDVESGAMLRSIATKSVESKPVMVSPSGDWALCSDGSRLRVWDIEGGTMLRKLKWNSAPIQSASATADGSRAVTGGYKALKVWDLVTGKVLRKIGQKGVVESVAVSPDGLRAISWANDQMLRVWDLETGRLQHAIEWRWSLVKSLLVTPDGRRALVASRTSIDVLNIEEGNRLRTLDGPTQGISSIALFADGRRVLAALDSGSDSLRVWDLDRGVVLATFAADCGGVWSARASSHGVIVAGGADGAVYFLQLENA